MPGPLITDLTGTTLLPEEREFIQHPLIAGIILFARNYESPAQITELCQSIRAARKEPILITVDQEGGRVQRFKEGFTRLLPMGEIGKLANESLPTAKQLAYHSGWLMAAELQAVGVDLSFAPVLDLNKNKNTVIGDRGFSSQTTTVIELAQSLIEGMQTAGMIATGKHFPGHGDVTADSHLALPVDMRSLEEVTREDMQPFIALIKKNIQAIMPAYILFPAIDNKPVGFSSFWLQTILRKQLQFNGVIFSDDLNMAGAGLSENYAERAALVLEAGCDIALLCNNRQGTYQALDELSQTHTLSQEKFNLLRSSHHPSSLSQLQNTIEWQQHFNSFTHCQETLCKQ